MLTPMNAKRHDLTAAMRPEPTSAGKSFLVREPGLTQVLLTMAPGQGMPVHDHPGATVSILGLVGQATVYLEGVPNPVKERELISFPGEHQVSPRNDSDALAVVLITLAERVPSD